MEVITNDGGKTWHHVPAGGAQHVVIRIGGAVKPADVPPVLKEWQVDAAHRQVQITHGKAGKARDIALLRALGVTVEGDD